MNADSRRPARVADPATTGRPGTAGPVCTLGPDLGTSSAKAVVVDTRGKGLSQAVVSALGLEASLLAPLLPSAGAPAGHLTAAAGTELGRQRGPQPQLGAGDHERRLGGLYASADHRGQAHDLIFVPHLSGERTPYCDPALRGSWTALSLACDRTSLLRSALEGTAFAIRDALDAERAAGHPDGAEGAA